MIPRNSRGFTLIEILVTLLILAIALPSVVALVLGNARSGTAASERNVAGFILNQAIEDISRVHRITKEIAADPLDVGLFIETNPNASVEPDPGPPVTSRTLPTIHFNYQQTYVIVNGKTHYVFECMLPAQINPEQNLFVWPYDLRESPRYGGPVSLSSPSGASGIPFRVFYSISAHPEWATPAGTGNGQASPMAGIYVLTLAVYRDLSPGLSIKDANKRYEQISEPIIVYLSSRRAPK